MPAINGKGETLAVLVTATTWWPLSARLAERLLAYGARVSALCPQGHPLRSLPALEAVYPYRTFRTGRSLERAILASGAEVVIPADDLAMYEFGELARTRPQFQSLYERSAGSLDNLGTLVSRTGTWQLANRLGIPAAQTLPVADLPGARAAAQQLGYPVLLKKDGTWGGNGVAVVRTPAELPAALAAMQQPGSATSWKRRLVNGDRLAFARQGVNTGALSMQRFIPGVPANAMFAAQAGRLLAEYQVRVCASQGQTGAALVVQRIHDARIHEAGARLAGALQLSGFFGLDFMLAADGVPSLIEVNPRCTQLGHLALPDGTDLAGHMHAAWSGEPVPHTGRASAEHLAFFPQAARYAGQARFPGVPLDLPQTEELRQFLLGESWPERRLLARLYHAVRPVAEVEMVEYEPQPAFSTAAKRDVSAGQPRADTSGTLQASGAER